jgi:hypothetical protein
MHLIGSDKSWSQDSVFVRWGRSPGGWVSTHFLAGDIQKYDRTNGAIGIVIIIEGMTCG